MQALYDLVARAAGAGLLPQVFAHPFMVRGLLAALLLGPLFGGMGTLVVARRLSFFVQAIGNAAMTGTAIGLLLGEPAGATWAGVFGFCLIAALVMTWLQNRGRIPADTLTGLFLAQTLGLGVVMLTLVSKRFDIHQVEGALFGSLITIGDADLLFLAAVALGTAIAGSRLYNAFLLGSLSPALAAVRGRRPLVLDYVFVVLVTAVVTAGLKLIGALLILVLIVVPAAAAQNVARNLRQMMAISIALSTAAAVGGLVVSGLLPIPTGGAIALVSTALFYLTFLARTLTRKETSR